MRTTQKVHEVLAADANVAIVKDWISSTNKVSGEERGLRITPEDVKRLKLKHPGREVALLMKKFIRTSGQKDLNVRIYNFPDRTEVWVSYEPKEEQVPLAFSTDGAVWLQ
jgi:hypothetical protein